MKMRRLEKLLVNRQSKGNGNIAGSALHVMLI